MTSSDVVLHPLVPVPCKGTGGEPDKILVVSGTRPELVKLAPLFAQFQALGLAFRHIFTGQHTSLAEQTREWSALITPFEGGVTSFLETPSSNEPLEYAQEAYEGLLNALRGSRKPELVLVLGDTASSVAGGRLAAALEIPLAHVESGLRTFDEADPWPEEAFRVELDHLASLRFAPTPTSMGNLLAENLQHGSHLVGNTVVDALRLAKVEPVTPGRRAQRLLVTLHRRESFGEPLRKVAEGIARFAKRHGQLEVLWPMHPNPRVKASIAEVELPPNVRLLGPLPYLTFSTLLASSRAVLTDSGGVTEEAATLGVPCIIARRKTERPEALASKQALLQEPDPDGVAAAIGEALGGALRAAPSQVFGDGHAAERICGILQDFSKR